MPVRKKPIAEENPLFKWILIIDFAVLLMMIGVMIFVVCVESNPATEMQRSFFEFGRNVATLLAGTFAGLAGAKAGRPSHLADQLPQKTKRGD